MGKADTKTSLQAEHWQREKERIVREWRGLCVYGQVRLYRTLQDLVRDRFIFVSLFYSHGHQFPEAVLDSAGGWDERLLGSLPGFNCSGDRGAKVRLRPLMTTSLSMIFASLSAAARQARDGLTNFAIEYGPRESREIVNAAGGWPVHLMGEDPLASVTQPN